MASGHFEFDSCFGFGVVTISATLRWVSWAPSQYIKNNAWVTMNEDFLSRVRRFGNDFTSDEVTSENHCRIASRVTKKSLFTVTNVLFYFLHAILCHEHTYPLRTIIECSFRHCCQWRPFLTEHCDVTTIDLWHHANEKYWYCDVIFVYCHCTQIGAKAIFTSE